MNNLSQSKIEAKRNFLARQRAEMISRYKQSDRRERNAIIRQIDSFLPVLKGDEKSFWLKLRRELERINEESASSKLRNRAIKCFCGETADYDGKYCWTCVERMIEDSEGENQNSDDIDVDPKCEDAPF